MTNVWLNWPWQDIFQIGQVLPGVSEEQCFLSFAGARYYFYFPTFVILCFNSAMFVFSLVALCKGFTDNHIARRRRSTSLPRLEVRVTWRLLESQWVCDCLNRTITMIWWYFKNMWNEKKSEMTNGLWWHLVTATDFRRQSVYQPTILIVMLYTK